MTPIKLDDLKAGMAVKVLFSTGHEVTGTFEGLAPALTATTGRLVQIKSGDQTVSWKESMITRYFRPEAKR